MKEMKTLTVNGVTYAVTDPTASRIDDSMVGDAPWSARKIIDTLTPPFAAEGGMVTCEPVAGYPLAVTAEDGATAITRCGKNLCNIGTVTFIQELKHTNAVLLPAGEYTLTIGNVESTDTDHTNMSAIIIYNMDRTQTLVTYYPTRGTRFVRTFTLPEATDKISLFASASWSQGAGDTATYTDVQLEVARTDTAYEPFQTAETFAPGETVPALPGVNTIWADTGSITVTGRTDPVAILRKLGGTQDVL